MKIYKNSINGKDYLYAYDNLFISKGKSVKKIKSLGPIDSSADISKKKDDFRIFLTHEEARLRVKYWTPKIHSKKFNKYASLEKLEKVRAQLYRDKMEMGENSIARSAMNTAFLVDFIYNSNKIEGSKIPRESIEKRIRQEEKPKNDEVTNTLKAIYYIENQFKFNLKQIDQLHSILLAHEPSNLGYRKERVVVGEQEVAHWSKVKPQLKALLEWYKKAEKTWYPPELAFEFYYRFERIHPFIDGNGRTGRLLMNKVLKDHRYHPMIIWNKRSQAHGTAFESYLKGKGENYFKFMADQFVKTHEIYIEKIERAFNLEKQLSYFLEPSEYMKS